LFIAAAERLGAPIETAVVVGDSIWDMLAAARCRALGVGLLCGGYGASELQEGSAPRVYEEPAHLLQHIHELWGRRCAGPSAQCARARAQVERPRLSTGYGVELRPTPSFASGACYATDILAD